jgi:fimbrial chaperone protein
MNAFSLLLLMIITVLCAIGTIQNSWASSFSVEPVRVILDLQHPTERMVVKNEADRTLTVLIKAYRWTQAADGKDQYRETDDLVIFPRTLTLAAGEERFVRLGVGTAAEAQEKSFRIYIEEQPVKDALVPKGANARILMRLGIPVFAQPLKPVPALTVKDLSAAKGLVRLTLVNEGNSFLTTEQITIKGLDAQDAEIFARDLGGLYLLAGSSHPMEVALPKEQCSRITKLTVTTRNEGKAQQKLLNMTFDVCEGK